MKNLMLHSSAIAKPMIGMLTSLIMFSANGQQTLNTNETNAAKQSANAQVNDNINKGTVNTRALAMFKKDIENKETSQINAKVVELKDNAGLVYLGAVVSKAQLHQYLEHFKNLEKENFETLRQNQANRDHHQFHMTLINPFEYQTIKKEKLPLEKMVDITLYGLGSVAEENKRTYYVVASSAAGAFIRQSLLLKPKDFHVTLGFDPTDIYSKGKGIDTLIKQ